MHVSLKLQFFANAFSDKHSKQKKKKKKKKTNLFEKYFNLTPILINCDKEIINLLYYAVGARVGMYSIT